VPYWHAWFAIGSISQLQNSLDSHASRHRVWFRARWTLKMAPSLASMDGVPGQLSGISFLESFRVVDDSGVDHLFQYLFWVMGRRSRVHGNSSQPTGIETAWPRDVPSSEKAEPGFCGRERQSRAEMRSGTSQSVDRLLVPKNLSLTLSRELVPMPSLAVHPIWIA